MSRSRIMALAIALAAAVLPQAEAQPPATDAGTSVRCMCFDWIHGPDFGTSCEPTRRACEREAAAMGRDHTECRAMRRARCDDEATVDGQRMTHP